jgi:hypothetical protein
MKAYEIIISLGVVSLDEMTSKSANSSNYIAKVKELGFLYKTQCNEKWDAIERVLSQMDELIPNTSCYFLKGMNDHKPTKDLIH